MPELPEVQTVVNTLWPRVRERVMTRVRLARLDIVEPRDCNLPGLLHDRRIVALVRRGKRIVFTLDDRNRFYIHLGMTGRIGVEPRDAPSARHTHLRIDLDDQTQLRFVDPRRFGGIFWLGQSSETDDGMGPEPLTLKPARLASLLAGTTRAIKNALLDQTLIAGLGNIYVDESLFAAKIHPLTPADALSLTQVRALNRAIKRTLRRAIHHRGSTLRDYRDADGNAGGFQSLHRVYHRAGEPCPLCGAAIARIVIGGRSTHFCPLCQPRARPRRAKS
jgi:formamidopyrimidine-DNA glycosylase